MREEFLIQRKLVETGDWFTVMSFVSRVRASVAFIDCKANCPDAEYRLIKRTTTVEEEEVK